MNAGTEYGNKIAAKMSKLQAAFHAQLNPENGYFSAVYNNNNGDEEAIATELAHDDDFIYDYLYTEIMELTKAILDADIYGMYTAGFVPFAKTREEYREKEREQTEEYYAGINKAIKSKLELDAHYAKLAAYYADKTEAGE